MHYRRILDAVITEGPQRQVEDDQRYRCFDLYVLPLCLCLDPFPDLASHRASFLQAGSLQLSGYAVERDSSHDGNLQAKECLVVLQEWGHYSLIEQLLTWLDLRYISTNVNQQLMTVLL